MTMPVSVLIGTIRYRVSIDQDEWVKFEHGIQRSNDYGHTDNDAALILVNPKSAPAVQRLSLWHEILHALCEVTMGSPDWKHLGKTDDDREETVVRTWEHPTLAVLRDNPQMVTYLTGAE